MVVVDFVDILDLLFIILHKIILIL